VPVGVRHPAFERDREAIAIGSEIRVGRLHAPIAAGSTRRRIFGAERNKRCHPRLAQLGVSRLDPAETHRRPRGGRPLTPIPDVDPPRTGATRGLLSSWSAGQRHRLRRGALSLTETTREEGRSAVNAEAEGLIGTDATSRAGETPEVNGARADVAPDTTAPLPIPPNPTPQRIPTGRTHPPSATTRNCFASRRPGTARTT